MLSKNLQHYIWHTVIYTSLIIPIRRLFYSGPWQKSVIHYYQRKYPLSVTKNDVFNVPLLSSVLLAQQTDLMLDTLLEAHCLCGLQIKPNVCDQLSRLFIELNVNFYENPHRNHSIVRGLAEDPLVMALVSYYFKSTPELDSSYFVRTLPEYEHAITRATTFHRDFPDFILLTLMVYLSDVDGERSPHEVIPEPCMLNSWRTMLGDFGWIYASKTTRSTPVSVVAAKGHAALENIQLLHRRAVGKQTRKVMFLNYRLMKSSK
ncbi:hypothetical protein CWB96_19325 [Pseudoalteromonas citrea]|uniref:Uncharacterized protein n=1 Tax=Pseudoalteromonas citrea TaxID=43655 RepID=A0A5S3XJ95_9GAMM|nr:hypothetical protein [Pseudoalteromonas citrea]TMP45003.1 hypothetical protein CWB97_04095 [Pseudoalteromonas citrea]TMP54361.1 hypothetical protein CWB96_19325 [Pseudoalteromonas citrea]